MLEITTLYGLLEEAIDEKSIGDTIQVFVLHSQVPLPQQTCAFEPPGSEVMHVVLATNIAESSVTIPRLGLVINTALQQYSAFDSAQQMSLLRKTWSSKASCTQRAGRAGREFAGVVIHAIPRSLYSILPPFTTPEMSTAPLDKLYLSARCIGPQFGVSSPLKFLQLAPTPPLLSKLKDAIEYLAELGAIVSQPGVEVEDLAELTQLGHLAVGLPIDTPLSRLVLVGCCIGMAYEAVIVSAYLTMDVDLFVTPTPFSTRSASKYAEIVLASLEHRFSGDDGYYADTWLVCRVFDEWLKFFEAKSPTGSKSQCSKKFGEIWGVYPYRLVQLESQVVMIARSLRNLTIGAIRSQMDSLCHLFRVKQGKVDLKDRPSLCSDQVKFKSLFLLAFPNQVIHGRGEAFCGVPGVEPVAKEELQVMKENGFEPSCSLTMRKLKGKCNQPESLEQLVKAVLTTPQAEQLLYKQTGFVHVSAKPCEEKEIDENILFLWQYADRGAGGWSPIGSNLKFPVLRHPLQVFWQRLSRASETVRNLSFRNRPGLLLDIKQERKNFVGVACKMTIRAENFVTARMVTVLPCIERHNQTTLVCLLSALPMYSELDLLVSPQGVIGCKVAGVMLEDECYLSMKVIERINSFRRCLSAVWQASNLAISSKLEATNAAFNALFLTSPENDVRKQSACWKPVISPPMISDNPSPFEEETNEKTEQVNIIDIKEYHYYPVLDLTQAVSQPKPDFSVEIPSTENWDV